MGENWRAARLVWRYAYRADPARSAASVAVGVASMVCDLLGAVVLKMLVDAASRGDTGGVTAATGLLVLSLTGSLLGHWATVTVGIGLRERATLYFDTRMAELAATIHHLEHHERPDYLDELHVLRRDHQRLAGVQDALVANLVSAGRLVITIGILASIHPLLLFLPVAGIPSVLATARNTRRRHAAHDELAAAHRLSMRLFELGTTRGAGKELRLYGLRDPLQARFDTVQAEADAFEDRLEARIAVTAGLGWLAFGLGFAGAALLVAREAVGGRATPGDVVLALTMAGAVNAGVSNVAGTVGWLLDNLKTGKRLLWLETLAAEAALLATPASPRAVPGRLTDGIHLDGVTFRYPATGEDVLAGVDLFLPAGSTVAIVGDNGAGKTTLVKLLCRLYDPNGGRITVDGVDLRDMDVSEWRARLSGCFQDFARLELLAREAVGVGHLPDLDDEPAVIAALDRAHAAELPTTLPGGLAAQLGRSFDDGVEPSTGQWQKLALGRAMMRHQPLLLVLDEPTASLDPATEHALFERYSGAASEAARRAGAITVLVSHRFSTVRMADLIVVFSGGRVAELGTHEDLLAAGGGYAELYGLQARAYG